MNSVIIIGSGPAALTAAIYAARADLGPKLFEGDLPGGQLTTTSEVENFPGFTSISGSDLVEAMRSQAESAGTQIYSETVIKIEKTVEGFTLTTRHYSGNKEYRCRALILATGATANRLTFPGSETFWNRGISACAVCDGSCPIFRGKPIVVVGGGDSAMEEALYLSKFGSKIIIVHRRDIFRASPVMLTRARNCPTIEFMVNCRIVEALGSKFLEEIIVENTHGVQTRIPAAGLFYGIGHTPNSELVRNWVDIDSDGYIVTKPGTTETSIPGLFAAGDVQDRKWRQAITAAGSGCIAALQVAEYLETSSPS